MLFLLLAAERKSRLANAIPHAFAQLAPFKRIECRLLLSYCQPALMNYGSPNRVHTTPPTSLIFKRTTMPTIKLDAQKLRRVSSVCWWMKVDGCWQRLAGMFQWCLPTTHLRPLSPVSVTQRQIVGVYGGCWFGFTWFPRSRVVRTVVVSVYLWMQRTLSLFCTQHEAK